MPRLPLLLFCLILLTPGLPAAVIHVPLDAPDPESAVDLAADGDTILIAPGTWVVPTLVVQHSLVIQGLPSGTEPVILDGSHANRLLNVTGSSVVQLSGLILQNGLATSLPFLPEGGAIHANGSGRLELTSCTIRNCTATTAGAIFANDREVRLIDCEILENRGGGLFLESCETFLLRCLFRGNQGLNGGAIDVRYGSIFTDECRFLGNRASGTGGAVNVLYASLVYYHTLFEGNRAASGAVAYGRTHVFHRCTFIANQSFLGSLSAGNGRFNFFGCQIVSQMGSHWSGCAGNDPEIHMENCNVWNNSGGDYTGCVTHLEGVAGNRSEDPLFCSPGDGVYTLQADSPSLPEATGLPYAIGAFPVGECDLPGAAAYFFAIEDSVRLHGEVRLLSASIPPDASLAWDLDGDGQVDGNGSQITWRPSTTGWHSAQLVSSTDVVADTTRVDSLYFVRTPRVHHVPNEFPDIPQALAASLPGDTVQVARGTWYVSNLSIPSGVALRGSIEAPDSTVLSGAGLGRVLNCAWSVDSTVVEGFRIQEGVALGTGMAGMGGALRLQGSPVIFRDCVFSDNQAVTGGVALVDQYQPRFERCTFAGNSGLEGASVLYTSTPVGNPMLDQCILSANIGPSVIGGPASLYCTVIGGNDGENWTDNILEQLGQQGNEELDPLFCDPAAGDYRLSADSPLWGLACGVPGALRRDCENLGAAQPVLPRAFALRCYPNPFNPRLTVEWHAAGISSWRLYDMRGSLRERGELAAGKGALCRISVDGRGLASGVYVIQVQSGTRRAQEKVLLLK